MFPETYSPLPDLLLYFLSVKRFLSLETAIGFLFIAGWCAGFYFFRHAFNKVMLNLPFQGYELESLSTFSLVCFYLYRVGVVIPLLGAVGLGTKLLQAYAPSRLLVYRDDPLLISNPRRKRKTNRTERKVNRFLARCVFVCVLGAAVVPGGWVTFPKFGGCAILLLTVGLMAIEWIGALGISQAVKRHYGFSQRLIIRGNASVPAPMFMGILMFICLTLFLACHLPYYSAAAWAEVLPYGEARHHLLMLHALILWTFLPFYFFSMSNRRILFNFVALNLWFVPWTKAARAAGRFSGFRGFGGGSSGGAGASGAFR